MQPKNAMVLEKIEIKKRTGCLQYFTGTAGSFSSFNLANNIHLADQVNQTKPTESKLMPEAREAQTIYENWPAS